MGFRDSKRMDVIPPLFVDALQNEQCYSHPTSRIALVETHISWVFLTGQYVYKIKKPARFAFVDFSTLKKRRWFCEEEVRINRRLAPELYLGVVPITGCPSKPYVDGEGIPFEYAVQMKQFLPDQEFHKLLAAGKMNEQIMNQLAIVIGEFHSRIEAADESSLYGRLDVVRKSVKECFEEIALDALTIPLQNSLQEVKEWTTREWKRLRLVLVKRKSSGHVRECHGDLHLGNIAIFEDQICVFDALEFSPRLRWIDVISEIAFLVMDLKSKDREDLAYCVLNRYLEVTGDYAGMSVFRLYAVYRALVRVKVAGLRLAQVNKGSPEWNNLRLDMISYVELANRLIRASSTELILMHGLSGSGKTTVSTEVMKTLGTVRIRSDVERKRLLAENNGCRHRLTKDSMYSLAVTQATYDRLLDHANIVLKAGFSVIVDATFLRIAQRQSFIQLAHNCQVPFVILDVWAPEEILAQRIEWRAKQGKDVSDATVDVMQTQKTQHEPLIDSERSRTIRVDTSDAKSIRASLKNFLRKKERREN